MNIKRKIILPIILTAVIVLSVATFYSYIFNVNSLKTSISEHLETAVSSRSHHIDTFLKAEKEKVKMMSSSFIFKNIFDKDNSNYNVNIKNACERVNKIAENDKTIYELFILDKEGKIVCSSDKENIGLDKSNDDYFIKGKEEIYIKDAYYSETTKKESLAISSPIVNQTGEHLGIMVARIDMMSLKEILLDKTGLGETGEIYIINKEGYAITPLQSSEDTFLKLKVESENAQNCLTMLNPSEGEVTTNEEHQHTGHKASIVFQDYRGTSVLGSHHPSHILNWCVLAEIDEAEVLAPTKDLLIFSLARILIVLSLFFLIAYLLARNISKPIIALRQGVEIITKGNLAYKVGTRSKDEIGQLSRAFDEMTLAIKKSHSEVEEKVRTQTKEITEKQGDMENQQIATLNILEDVEEEKELTRIEKEKIETILHSIGDGVFVVNKDKEITIFNQAAVIISGFSKDEAIGKKYEDVLKFIHEKDRTPNTEFVDKAFETGKTQLMKNHTLLIRKDKSEVSVADSSAPIKDKAGHIIGCIVVFRDATEERKAEKIKSDFVSIASHQLRTPLTGIQWVTERLLKHSTALPEKDKKYVDDINLSAKRLSILVDSLLNVSRIEGGKISIKPEEIELIDFIQSYLSETVPLTIKKNLELKFNIHPEKLDIITDRAGIRNIVQSLVSNAIEYTPQDGKIEVSVEDSDKKDFFLFKVKDNGIGIPKRNQATLFDKFTRGDNAQQVKTDGTGFGLYIARQTCDLLGGEIRFESIENEGTTFFVTLPKESKAKEGGKSFA